VARTTIETVSGPIAADELGLTLVHEHFQGEDEAVTAQWPHLRDRDAEYALALEQAHAVVGHGVKTIVEPTAMLLGRDVRLLQRIASDTGLQIVACTGIYTYDHLPTFFQTRDVDFMASCFVHDIERGIQGTDVKAAFIKCAADEAGITENIEKVHRAAARASVQTGVPIMAHSRPSSATGPHQIQIFRDEGVPPERIQIAHTGDSEDLDYIERLLAEGVYIGMDRYGLEVFLPMAQRNATVTALLERGHADRMLLSQDYVAAFDWYAPELAEQMIAAGMAKDWSMTLLFEQVIPALKSAGVTDEQLDTMMVENPRRWLTA
jgi:phosphotriesterase-related protein